MDIKKLKEAAEKATPGPWRATAHFVIAEETEDRLGFQLRTKGANGNRDDWRRLSTYIAASNPAAVLELIASHERLVEALSTLVKRIEYYSSLADDERPNIEQWEYTEGSGDMNKARAALAAAEAA